MARHRDQRDVRGGGVELQQLGRGHAVQHRHLDVQHDGVRLRLLSHGQRALPVLRFEHLEAAPAQKRGESPPDRGFIVHHQDRPAPLALPFHPSLQCRA
jgi:hypothetical protein